MKIRSDFVTNSSSSSFVSVFVNSPVLAEIMNDFKDMLIEKFGGEEDGLDVFQFNDESFGIDGNEWICSGFPESVEEVPEELACLLEDNDWDADDSMEELISEIRDRSDEIAESISHVDWTNSDYGWGGDSDSRYYEENYDEKTFAEIKEQIMQQHDYTSVDQITDEDFSFYVGDRTSMSVQHYFYDKASGKEDVDESFSLD